MRNSIVLSTNLAKGDSGWTFEIRAGTYPRKLWVEMSIALGKRL